MVHWDLQPMVSEPDLGASCAFSVHSVLHSADSSSFRRMPVSFRTEPPSPGNRQYGARRGPSNPGTGGLLHLPEEVRDVARRVVPRRGSVEGRPRVFFQNDQGGRHADALHFCGAVWTDMDYLHSDIRSIFITRKNCDCNWVIVSPQWELIGRTFFPSVASKRVAGFVRVNVRFDSPGTTNTENSKSSCTVTAGVEFLNDCFLWIVYHVLRARSRRFDVIQSFILTRELNMIFLRACSLAMESSMRYRWIVPVL